MKISRKNIDPSYLRCIYDGLINGSISADNESSLPEGLIGSYEVVFNESIPALKRQQTLEWFVFWALLKKEVSVSFFAELIQGSEADVLEFIATYSAWFNSTKSSKYQLYHERMKVYLLQKLTDNEVIQIHKTLISRLEIAIKEQSTDEFERYALKFLGNHLYSLSSDSLFELSLNNIVQNRQISFLNDFMAPLLNIDLALILAKQKGNTFMILKLSAAKLSLRKRLHEDLQIVYDAVNQNNTSLVINLLSLFEGKQKALVSVVLFHEFFEGKFRDHKLKQEFITLIMEELSTLETDRVKRGWLLSLPKDALEIYFHELYELSVDDFHLRKLTEIINFEIDFSFDETDFNLEDFQSNNSDMSNLLDEDFPILNYSNELDSESAIDPNTNITKNFFHDNSNENKDSEENIYANEDSDFDDEEKLTLFNEAKERFAKELLESSNKKEDLKKYTQELEKIDKSVFKKTTQFSLLLILSIRTHIEFSEFDILYQLIIEELKERKNQYNPVAYAHEFRECCELLIEHRLFKKVLELIPLNSRPDMRDELYEAAICGAYIVDKEIYHELLLAYCRINLIDTANHVNKGSLLREYLFQNKHEGLEQILSSENDLFRTFLCGIITEDVQSLKHISSNDKLISIFLKVFQNTIDPSLSVYSRLLSHLLKIRNDNLDSPKDGLILAEQLTLLNNNPENLNLIYFCLNVLHKDEHLMIHLLNHISDLLSNNPIILEASYSENNELRNIFQTFICLWANCSNDIKALIRKTFKKLIDKTKAIVSNEKAACIFLIDNPIALNDFVFIEKSVDLKVPIILLKHGYINEAMEVFTYCKDKTKHLLYLEVLVEFIETAENPKELIEELITLIQNEFNSFCSDINIEVQSFTYVSFFARIANVIFSCGERERLKLIYLVMMDHIATLSVSQNEKIKLLTIFSNTISNPVFFELLRIGSVENSFLLSASVSFFKKHHYGIEQKIYDSLVLIRNSSELVESALIHLAKQEYFFNDSGASLIETQHIFDFSYWHRLKQI